MRVDIYCVKNPTSIGVGRRNKRQVEGGQCTSHQQSQSSAASPNGEGEGETGKPSDADADESPAQTSAHVVDFRMNFGQLSQDNCISGADAPVPLFQLVHATT